MNKPLDSIPSTTEGMKKKKKEGRKEEKEKAPKSIPKQIKHQIEKLAEYLVNLQEKYKWQTDI
jgi:hypothetical protein